MNTYISLLRGINVSGHRMVGMDALRQLFADMGFFYVQTYIQSGNVIFQSAETNPHVLEGAITETFAAAFGFQVPVLVRELEELRQIVARNPFAREPAANPAHWHATFLAGPPRLQAVENLPPDECRLLDSTVYLCCPDGYGRTKWNNGFLEKKLGVAATTRNWKTVCRLLSLADEARPL